MQKRVGWGLEAVGWKVGGLALYDGLYLIVSNASLKINMWERGLCKRLMLNGRGASSSNNRFQMHQIYDYAFSCRSMRGLDTWAPTTSAPIFEKRLQPLVNTLRPLVNGRFGSQNKKPRPVAKGISATPKITSVPTTSNPFFLLMKRSQKNYIIL